MRLRCHLDRDADVHAPNAINVGKSKFAMRLLLTKNRKIVRTKRHQHKMLISLSLQNTDS